MMDSPRDADFEPSKIKFMCSYGGKIQPRSHDNQLSYVGGETKILAVHRSVTFATLLAKLTALCLRDVSFKYQLPGEDLDALISVTNDADLEHMMHEHDRLNKASSSPAKLRLFLLPVSSQSPAFTSVHSFGSTTTDALDSAHLQPKELENGMASTPQEQETAVIDEQIQKHIHDLHRLGIAEPALYRKPSNDNLTAAYVPKEIAPQISPDQQPVYMIQAPPAGMYHTSNAMPPASGYYVQRMPVHDQPVYDFMPQPPQQQFVAQMYTEGYQMVTDGQVAGAGSQIYYTTHGVVAQPLQQQYPENVAKEFM